MHETEFIADGGSRSSAIYPYRGPDRCPLVRPDREHRFNMFTHKVSIKNQLLPNNLCQCVPFLVIFGHEQYQLVFYAKIPFITTLHICSRSTGLECVS